MNSSLKVLRVWVFQVVPEQHVTADTIIKLPCRGRMFFAVHFLTETTEVRPVPFVKDMSETTLIGWRSQTVRQYQFSSLQVCS